MNITASFPDLKGKSVFITGGGSGIGAYLTEGFLVQGANVAFIQRSDATEFATKMAQKHGNTPLAIEGDITDVTALQQAINTAAEQHGSIDVLINNAANDYRHSLKDTSVADWDTGQNINLRPHFFAIQAVAEKMQAKGSGSIINVSSVSYMMGNAGYPGYVAANAGITGLTRGLARELGGDNIRVNALMPGWVLTGKQLGAWATPEALAEHINKQCLKEHLKPQDMVGAALFLASDISRMMTGQAMVVDGGVVVTG